MELVVDSYTEFPSATVVSWPFALYLAQERAALRMTKQQVHWDSSRNQWKVSDK